MKTLLARLLVKEEDFVPHGYLDHLGYLTIGIGRLIDKRKGGGISEEEAIYLLANDINKIAAKLDIALPWWKGLDEVRRVVLMSMAFQMGVDFSWERKAEARMTAQEKITRAVWRRRVTRAMMRAVKPNKRWTGPKKNDRSSVKPISDEP